jgi:hypothetical protein
MAGVSRKVIEEKIAKIDERIAQHQRVVEEQKQEIALQELTKSALEELLKAPSVRSRRAQTTSAQGNAPKSRRRRAQKPADVELPMGDHGTSSVDVSPAK